MKSNLLLSWQVSFLLNTYQLFLCHVVDDIHELLDHNDQLVHEDHEYDLENKIILKKYRRIGMIIPCTACFPPIRKDSTKRPA
jgi:vesicle coat complex subunit